MFWTILGAISYAIFFYSLGKRRGFDDGQHWAERRATEMLNRMNHPVLSDEPPPSRDFGKRRMTLMS